MVCKKLKCYSDVKVILDNYGQYIDFQYRAVSNIWSSVEIEDKLLHAIIYKNFLENLKEIREEYYKAQKSFCNTPPSRSFCEDECTCENLGDLKFEVEREILLKVYHKLYRMNSKIHDFNLLCERFMSNIFENNMYRLERKLNYKL